MIVQPNGPASDAPRVDRPTSSAGRFIPTGASTPDPTESAALLFTVSVNLSNIAEPQSHPGDPRILKVQWAKPDPLVSASR